MKDGISLKSISHPEGTIEFLASKIREMGGYCGESEKKFRDELLLGEGIILMEAPGEGKAIVVRENYYEIIDIKECPKCCNKDIECHGASENGLDDLYYCEKCEKWFENNDPNHT